MEKRAEFNIVIDADRIQKEYFKDLFRYRDLFYLLAWRDILVRYKQTALGVAWAILRPLITMMVFAFVFGKVAKLPSSSINYSLFVLVGLLPWQLFSFSVIDSSFCLVNNAHLVSKIYFPRLIILVSSIMVNLVDFLIGMGMMAIALVVLGEIHSWTALLIPLFILQTLLLCLGVGLWLSALTVRFRDLRFVVQFIVQFGMFISPIGYGSFVIPYPWKWVFFLNPVAGIIDGFRWAIFGIPNPDLGMALLFSVSMIALLLGSGFAYFRTMERTIADVI